MYARVNEFGFVETPYRVVDNSHRVTTDIVYLSALEEERETIAPASIGIDKKGNLIDAAIPVRRNGSIYLFHLLMLLSLMLVLSRL